MTSRLWLYQKERFPLVAHGPMVLVFCLSVMLYSSLQQAEIPSALRIIGAAVSALIFFLQLRVADEFKDFDVDARYRPQRPVPRGLVSLRELAGIAWGGAAIQFAIAVSIDVGLVPLLVGVWAWIGLMTREFFVAEWLRKHPAAYLLSHMLVMPAIACYVSAFDWLCDCREMPAGLGWLLLLSFAIGLVIELGRKIRTPGNEQEGVETYSALWGARAAVLLWASAVVAAVAAYSRASAQLGGTAMSTIIASGVLLLGLLIATAFLWHRSRSPAARYIEAGSGLVAMLLYVGLGPLQAVLS